MKSKVVVYGFAALCILAAVAVQKISADKVDVADVDNSAVVTKGESAADMDGKSNAQSNAYNIEILAQSADTDGEILLTRVGYVTSYNIANKQPKWVGWRLTGDQVTGPNLGSGRKLQAQVSYSYQSFCGWHFHRISVRRRCISRLPSQPICGIAAPSRSSRLHSDRESGDRYL